MGPFGSDLELAELLLRTLSDMGSPKPTDIAYLFGNTADNQFSVIERGVALFHAGKSPRLGICDFPRFAGYQGPEAWATELTCHNIPRENIVLIDGAQPISHTHTEAEHLIRRARDEGWMTIIIVAIPVHQLRAFMDTVGVLIREKLDHTIRVWNAVGLPQPWTAEVVHSQGVLRARRHELVRPELERIVRYWGKGDMPTTRQVLDYLNWRDGA